MSVFGPASTRESVGHSFSSADSDETILSAPSSGSLALILVVVDSPSGLTSPTVTLKDGSTQIGKWSVTSDDAATLLQPAVPARLAGALVAQVSNSNMTVSAWGIDVV